MLYDFETGFALGVDQHANGDYRSALTYRINAFGSVPPRPCDRG
jgi:hypothetical protein